jgi:hypothetical protein
MKSWIVGSGAAALAIALVLGGGHTASAGIVDFDNVVAAPGGTPMPGDTFVAEGVVFWSVSAPNAVMVGQTITLSNVLPRMLVLGNANSISSPNFAAASGVFSGNPNDLLMRFSAPVKSVRVVTDDAVETPNIVRLLALEPTGLPGQFVVKGIDTGLDNATSAPNNVLAVSANSPFSFALFQVTTEAEGIDNVRFEPAPDCAKQNPIDPDCFEIPPFKEWIPVGCEIVDCCPGCPGEREIDWVIRVDGNPFESLVLQFEGLEEGAFERLRITGNASWLPDHRLEVRGPGEVGLSGFVASGKTAPLWSATSPRMSIESIGGVAATAERSLDADGEARAIRVQVEQRTGRDVISHSTLVYRY